jgi:hypothetical protein
VRNLIEDWPYVDGEPVVRLTNGTALTLTPYDHRTRKFNVINNQEIQRYTPAMMQGEKDVEMEDFLYALPTADGVYGLPWGELTGRT